MQEFTSKDTSINSKKVPAVFRKVFIKPFEYPIVNLDLGGGRFDTATDYLAGMNVTNLIFDPFNRDFDHNLRVVIAVAATPANSATISNVLNVIKEREKRIEILERAKRWSNVTFITVYEGNKSGIGTATKKGWQENRKLADYITEVQEVFPYVKIKNGVIVAKNS